MDPCKPPAPRPHSKLWTSVQAGVWDLIPSLSPAPVLAVTLWGLQGTARTSQPVSPDTTHTHSAALGPPSITPRPVGAHSRSAGHLGEMDHTHLHRIRFSALGLGILGLAYPESGPDGQVQGLHRHTFGHVGKDVAGRGPGRAGPPSSRGVLIPMKDSQKLQCNSLPPLHMPTAASYLKKKKRDV